MTSQDAISLTRDLLRFDTINPPGRERDCAQMAGALLQQWGFNTEFHEYADSRTSVVARLGASDSKAPLCLTGHLDVVPLGSRSWSKDPFAGEADGDSARLTRPHVAVPLLFRRHHARCRDRQPQ